MANQKTRDKRRAAREKKLLKKQDQQLVIENEADDDLDLLIEDQEPVVAADPIQKSYEDEYGYSYPTSWEEVDAMREAQEKAEKVGEMSWTVRSLVGNIVRSNMSPDEKAKAISEVGSGFSTRIKTVGSSKVSKSTDDMDLLQIRALIAKDKRQTLAAEKVMDWIKKSMGGSEEKLNDEDFALVIKEEDTPVIRKYPIHTKLHIRKTLAEIVDVLEKSSNDVEIEHVRSIIPAVREAARKVGIGALNHDTNSVIIEKDSTGTWRAVMYPTNNFKDTDGEILSEAAHKEYVEWVNKNMDLAPVFVSWHIPETVRKNRVDFVDYESGFLLMSAPLEKEEAAGLLRVQEMCDLGMSHGTFALERDPANPKIITKYRMVEVSDLPITKAANPFTDFSVVSKEMTMNDIDKLKYLTGLLGEEKAKEFFDKAGLKQKALQNAGVEEKEAKPSDTATPASSAPVAQEAAPAVPGVDLDAIFKEIEMRLDVPGLQQFVTEAQSAMEKIPLLEALVKEKAASADDALADKIAPRITQKMAWTRPSQSADNVADETKEDDKTLIKAKPDASEFWLSQATNTEPLEVS